MIKVSVIIPVYNAEKYLPRALDSVINQTLKNIEIICIDDGSMDSSGNICDEYALKDSRIQVIHKENNGVVSARKAGLAIAAGEYVGFVDADDYIEPEMYEKMLEYITETGADFIHIGYMEDIDDSKYITYLPRENIVYDSFDPARMVCDLVLSKSSERMTIPYIWAKLFKRELVQRCHEQIPDNTRWGSDWLCTCLCILESKRIAVKQMAYYHYIVREGSLAHGTGAKEFIKRGILYQGLYEAFQRYGCLQQIDKHLVDFYIRNIINCIIIQGKNKDFSQFQLYKYPGIEQVKGKKIVIYGAGRVGQDYYTELCKTQSCKVVALADTFPERQQSEYVRTVGPNDLNMLDFDMIIIAVLSERTAEDIRQSLLRLGISQDKITWSEPEPLI